MIFTRVYLDKINHNFLEYTIYRYSQIHYRTLILSKQGYTMEITNTLNLYFVLKPRNDLPIILAV